MKLLRAIQMGAVLLVASAAPAFGQFVTVTSDVGDAGQLDPVNIDVIYTANPALPPGDTIVAFQVEVGFDAANLTPDTTFCDPGPTAVVLDLVSCSVPAPGVIRIIVENAIVGAVADQLTIPFPFDISGAGDGIYDLPILAEKFVNATADTIVGPGSVGGQIEVLPPPQPRAEFDPNPGSVLALEGAQGFSLITNLGVANVADNGTTLTGTCTINNDLDGKFSFVSDGAFSATFGSPDSVAVDCDSSEIGGPFTADLDCEHDGDGDGDPSPSSFDLTCTVNDVPAPAISLTTNPSPLDLATEVGEANPTGSVTIENVGDAGPLDGSCTYSGDPGISVDTTAYSLGVAANTSRTVTCDASATRDASGTISCTGGGGDSVPVSCLVSPGDAIYASAPVPGSTIDLTPDGPVLVDSDDPADTLELRNDATNPGDRDLAILGCVQDGDTDVISDTSAPVSIAPGGSAAVTFSCDTATAGNYSMSYVCNYDEDGDQESDGPANYTVTCDVRDPEAQVEESPDAGTTLNFNVSPGGSADRSVTFNEVLDEGIEGYLESCELDSGLWFEILNPPDGEGVSADTPQTVTVRGTAPANGDTQAFDELTCYFSDSDDDFTPVSWPLNLSVQLVAVPSSSDWSRLLLILALLGLGAVAIRRQVV